MVGRRACCTQVDGRHVGRIDKIGRDLGGARQELLDLARETGARQQQASFSIAEADADPVEWRIGVERQPGGTGLGDGDLANQ